MKRAPIGTFFHSEPRIGIDGCRTTFLCCGARPHKKTVDSRCDAKLAVHLGHADERRGAITPTPKAMRIRTACSKDHVLAAQTHRERLEGVCGSRMYVWECGLLTSSRGSWAANSGKSLIGHHHLARHVCTSGSSQALFQWCVFTCQCVPSGLHSLRLCCRVYTVLARHSPSFHGPKTFSECRPADATSGLLARLKPSHADASRTGTSTFQRPLSRTVVRVPTSHPARRPL